jgi:hypothetical protein
MTELNNMQDILDVRDIISRVEELREEIAPWCIGWNMPGYMPDSEPSAYATWEEARDSLADEIERFADQDAESEQPEEQHEDFEEALRVLRALPEGEEFGRTVGAYHYWLSLSHNVDPDASAELAELEALLGDLSGNGGDEQWEGEWYPITLIREDYFKEYAQELAEDIGAVNADATWPNNCIDWDQAARELKHDYTSTEYGGVTYYYR